LDGKGLWWGLFWCFNNFIFCNCCIYEMKHWE
jgi:hypothetical protein